MINQKRDMKKVLAIMLVLLTVVAVNAFAAIGDGTEDALSTILKNTVTYVFGYALGGILLVKFGIDLVGAIMKKDQDPAAVKKALIGFVATLVIVLAWQPILKVILDDTAKKGGVSSTGTHFVNGLLQLT